MEEDPTTENPPSKSKLLVWQELIAAQALSGQKVQVFCKEQGINYRVFYYWKKKLKWKGPSGMSEKTSLKAGLSGI